MNIFANARKERDNLLQRRAGFLQAAETAKNNGDTAGYNAKMAEAKALNTQIDELTEQVQEADRYAQLHAPKFGSDRKDLTEMGKAMAAGERVKIDVVDVFASMRTDEASAFSGYVTPQGGGSTIHDGFAGQVSSLLNQVNVQNLHGLGSWEEPYVVSDMPAQGGDVAANSGKTRTTTDPAFAKAGMVAYEATVTSFVDKKIANLSPADYAAKVQQMALRALHRKAVALMINGDGAASPKMYGFLTAKNTEGNAIFHTASKVTAIDENTLNGLIYGYGGDEMLGGNARLLLTKTNLEAFGNLKGTNEKIPMYEITFDAATGGNTGTLKRGGLIVPYTICSAIGDSKLAYGDPFNYMLILFSDYVIGVDNSYKAGERLATILGDVTQSGHLTVDKGMSIATLAAAAQN